MSPISTQLPAATLEWEAEYFLPTIMQTPSSQVGQGAGGFFDRLGRRPVASHNVLPTSATSTNSLAGYSSASGGLGGTILFQTRQGRPCIRVAVNAAAGSFIANDWRPADYFPHFGNPAQCAPGSTIVPGAVVGVWDWSVAAALAGGSPTWPNDSTGMFIARNEALDSAIPGIAAVADVEGCGVFLNSDGAGGAQFEYVSWAAGAPGAILERVVLGASTFANWSTVRFVVITGASGREMNVRVSLNGVQMVDRFCNSAELQRFNASGNTTGPAMKLCVGAGNDTFFYTMAARFGRFTPEGVQIQGQ